MVLPVIATICITAQALSLASAVPYRLDYFNPMLGGLDSAQHRVQVGWGEGGGEAIGFVIDDADGRDVTVQYSSAMPVFSYFATPNLHFDNFGLGTPAGWYETDYFITGIQEWQRGLSPSRDVMQSYGAAYEVSVEGVPFFEVYTPHTLPIPDHLREETGCTAVFGGALRLMQIVGRDGTIDLYWLTIGEVTAQYDVSVALNAQNTPEVPLPEAQSQLTVPANGYMSRVTIADPRPENAAPLSEYAMTIQVRDATSHELLPVTLDGSPMSDDRLVTHSECYYAE